MYGRTREKWRNRKKRPLVKKLEEVEAPPDVEARFNNDYHDHDDYYHQYSAP
jgi:hypothetical protein